MSTPADHGYAQCLACGTQRPAQLLLAGKCRDIEGCARWLAARDGGPFLPHAGSPDIDEKAPGSLASAKTGLDSNGDAE